MQDLCPQLGGESGMDALAELCVCLSRREHSFNVEAVLKLPDGLVKNAAVEGFDPPHQHFNIARVRRAHPASAVAAALIRLADTAKLRAEDDLLPTNVGSLCGAAV